MTTHRSRGPRRLAAAPGLVHQEAVGYFTGQLDAYPGLDHQTRTAIDHANATALFPRLALAGVGR